MNRQNQLGITYHQLKELFESLDKTSNYRQEIVNDYHQIISNLKSVLTLNNLSNFQIPLSALEGGPFLSDFEEKHFDGTIVRSKIKQLISVIKEELSILQKDEKQQPIIPYQEITLWSLVKKEINKFIKYIDNIRKKIENNIFIKWTIFIGACWAGLLLIFQFIFKFILSFN